MLSRFILSLDSRESEGGEQESIPASRGKERKGRRVGRVVRFEGGKGMKWMILEWRTTVDNNGVAVLESFEYMKFKRIIKSN